MRTMLMPAFWSWFSGLSPSRTAAARNNATPPPGTIPSSTAALVACRASSTRSLRSFTSTPVAPPTLMTATPPASFASRSCSFSLSEKEKKDRVEDALHATRAAVEEGILPGGGVPLLRAAKALEGLEHENDDQRTGVEIVRRAIQWPARYIVDNAGVDAAVVVGKLIENKDYAYGYDAQTGEYGDMFKLGIIDPTKVVRTALQDAASVAGLLIMTEAMVAEKPKKETPPPAMPGGGMDY